MRVDEESTAETPRARPEERRADPFPAWFVADWVDAVFVHFAIRPEVLGPFVAFPLDLYEGRAYVSLVAFTQRRLRPVVGGRVAEWAAAAAAGTHAFLNLRTYVRGGGRPAICFLAEWIPNWLARVTGPMLYGLPFRLGRLDYAGWRREVTAGGLGFGCSVERRDEARPAAAGSLDAFLVERYVAYTSHFGRGRRFEISHAPWAIARADVRVGRDDLIRAATPWFGRAERVASHVSAGVTGVRISGPHRVAEVGLRHRGH